MLLHPYVSACMPELNEHGVLSQLACHETGKRVLVTQREDLVMPPLRECPAAGDATTP